MIEKVKRLDELSQSYFMIRLLINLKKIIHIYLKVWSFMYF
jgi:hypothetical protein